MAARKRPSKRIEGRQQFTAPMTSKNSFPPLEVQAVSRRQNDKPAQKPRKGITEAGGGASS
jgi:hypothetical protein